MAQPSFVASPSLRPSVRILSLLEATHKIGYSGGDVGTLIVDCRKMVNIFLKISRSDVGFANKPRFHTFTLSIIFHVSKSQMRWKQMFHTNLQTNIHVFNKLFKLFKQTCKVNGWFPPLPCRMPCGCSMLTIASRMTLKTSTGSRS